MKNNSLALVFAMAGVLLPVAACNSKGTLLKIGDAAADQLAQPDAASFGGSGAGGTAGTGGSGGAVASSSPDASAAGGGDAVACFSLFHACARDADCCAPNRCLNITGTPACQQEGPAVGGSTAPGGAGGSGGVTGAGGSAGSATGGATGGGGTAGSATGGVIGTGGATGAGGVRTGGTGGTGGTIGSGGAIGGGGATASGGATSSGGVARSGGTVGTGGVLASGGNSGSGGTGADSVVYGGCDYIGDIMHVTIQKRDTKRNLCFTVSFGEPGTPSAGLTIPSGWGLSDAYVQVCSSGTVVLAATVSGTASWPATALPKTADINVIMTFPGGDAGIPASETLVATGVDTSGTCLF